MTDHRDDLDYDEFFVDSMLFGTKVCPQCQAEKPLSAEHWHHDSSTDDGFSACCKECRASGYHTLYGSDEYRTKHHRANAARRARKKATP